MKNLLVLTLLTLVFVACSREPFVEHKLSIEKKSDDCNTLSGTFRLTSNFGGERYEFEKCLPVGYDPKLLKAERRGDTVLVSFNATGAGGNACLVTLDIDSYPRYSYITIDENTYTVVQK